MQREGDNPTGRIPRWVRGPDGFLRKANRQLDVIERHLQSAPATPQQVDVPPVGKRGDGVFPALVTGNTTKSSGSANVGGEGSETVVYRWEYELHRASPSGDEWGSDGEGALTSAALNMREANHTARYSWGIDVEADDYPVGHRPRPIGGAGSDNTHKVDVPVMAWKASDGTYWFEAMGSHDGPCNGD